MARNGGLAPPDQVPRTVSQEGSGQPPGPDREGMRTEALCPLGARPMPGRHCGSWPGLLFKHGVGNILQVFWKIKKQLAIEEGEVVKCNTNAYPLSLDRI